jgi:hypothetical protein
MSLLDSLTGYIFWFPLVSLLLYVPVVCYLDLKVREVEHYYWYPLVLMNVPTVIMLLLDGNGLLYIPGLVATVIWFVAMRFHLFGGADFLYLTWISLFFIYNPISHHWLMVLPFTIYLVACLTISAMWIVIFNLFRGKGFILTFEHGVPMMFPISAALILTVVLA